MRRSAAPEQLLHCELLRCDYKQAMRRPGMPVLSEQLKVPRSAAQRLAWPLAAACGASPALAAPAPWLHLLLPGPAGASGSPGW
jgi:hypothetical protein